MEKKELIKKFREFKSTMCAIDDSTTELWEDMANFMDEVEKDEEDECPTSTISLDPSPTCTYKVAIRFTNNLVKVCEMEQEEYKKYYQMWLDDDGESPHSVSVSRPGPYIILKNIEDITIVDVISRTGYRKIRFLR